MLTWCGRCRLCRTWTCRTWPLTQAGTVRMALWPLAETKLFSAAVCFCLICAIHLMQDHTRKAPDWELTNTTDTSALESITAWYSNKIQLLEDSGLKICPFSINSFYSELDQYVEPISYFTVPSKCCCFHSFNAPRGHRKISETVLRTATTGVWKHRWQRTICNNSMLIVSSWLTENAPISEISNDLVLTHLQTIPICYFKYNKQSLLVYYAQLTSVTLDAFSLILH